VWTPYNRDAIDEEEESRKKYVDNFLKPLRTKKAKKGDE